MNKKLTLNIDDSLIEFAHNYSKQTHQSISSIVERYFIRLKADLELDGLSQSTNKIYGILAERPLPDKKVMRGEFHEKSIS